MAGARWAALAAVGVIVMGAAGCGGDDKSGGTKIALVTPGARDDPDWEAQLGKAAVKTAKRFHLGSQIVDPSNDAAARKALRRLAPDAQLLIAGHAADAAAARRIALAADVPTLVTGDPKALRPGLVGDVEVAWDEGAYAAGWAAARAAIERSVGIVLCDDGTAKMPDRFEIAAAFVAGAREQTASAKAAYGIVGADAQSAKEATLGLAARRIQMILAACGTAVPGVMQGVEKVGEREHQFVGLIGEKAALNRENVVLTSVLVDPTVAYEQAVRDIRTDRFGKRVYRLTFANRGLTLLQTGRVPSDAWELGIKVGQRISREGTELPHATNEVELDRIIAQAGRAG